MVRETDMEADDLGGANDLGGLLEGDSGWDVKPFLGLIPLPVNARLTEKAWSLIPADIREALDQVESTDPPFSMTEYLGMENISKMMGAWGVSIQVAVCLLDIEASHGKRETQEARASHEI